MPPTAEIELVRKIPSVYKTGLDSGDLLFFPSTVHSYSELNIQYSIRLCPALQKKPPLAAPDFAAVGSAKSLDPFSSPYNPNLFVGFLGDNEQDEEYVVLMNKYSVVPMHFLLVTREFKSQSSPLLPDELLHTYSFLLAARKANMNLFAFYNCGDLSGASQAHKHIQFLPLDEDEDGPPVEHLARSVTLEVPDKPFSLTALPYANHVYRFPNRFASLPEDKKQEIISEAFLSLLDLVVSTIRHNPDYPATRPSYNVIITLEHMHLIPRKQETTSLTGTGGKLSVNALGFAGMLLVKSEEELAAVKQEGVGNILNAVGMESVHEFQVKELSMEAEDISHL